MTNAFRSWEKAGVDFLILRNYESLPHAISNDIDVLVSPRQIRQAEEVLCAAARAAGFRRHNRAEFATLAQYFFSESGAQAHIDLFQGLQWRAFDFLSSDRFLTKKINKGLFSVPCPAHEAATSLLAHMIYTGDVKDKYKPFIVAGFKADPEEAIRLLAETYGDKQARFIIGAATAESWKELEHSTSALRRSLVIRQFVRQPFQTFGSFVRNGMRILRRYFRPPGLCIVLCGADGSGKSTVAKSIDTALTTTFPAAKGRYFHWKPPVFSGLRQAARGPATDPHGQPPRNPVASLVYFAAHWLEFFLGSHLRIRPVTFKGGLVLIDRYYYDFLVDQKRYRLQVPMSLARCGLFFLEKPALVLLLDAPPEVLQSRKQEVPFAETCRQREAYLAMIKSLPNGRIINAAQSPEAIVLDIKKIILEFMAERIERR